MVIIITTYFSLDNIDNICKKFKKSKMSRQKLLIVIALNMFVFNIFSQSNTEKVARPFGKGIINYTAEDNSWSTKMNIRFQTLFSTGYNVSPNLGLTDEFSNFMIRRARLKFTGHAFSPKLKYKMELGQSSRDIGGFLGPVFKDAPGLVFDAVVYWNFAEGFNLWVGQTKLPGNRERVISSGSLQLVDRSLLNSRFNIDRDMGVQLHHKWSVGDQMQSFVMKEILSISQGEGRGIVINNVGGFSYTGRLEFLPFGEFDSKGKDDYTSSSLKRTQSSKLAFALGGDFNNRAARTFSSRGIFMINDSDSGFYTTNITTLFIDLMYKYKGWSLMAEYAARKANDPIAKNEDDSLTGAVVMEGDSFNIMGAYLFESNWEITGRFTTVDYAKRYTISKDVFDENQFTLGVSKYISGHNLKIQGDVSYKSTDTKNGGILGRIQLELQL